MGKTGGVNTGNNFWFFVAENTKHMTVVKERSNSWWCVDRKCKIGDKAFLYKRLEGIVCYFEILGINDSQDICSSYGMDTGLIKILKHFKEPITAKILKSTPIVADETFVRRNFQGKSFVIKNEETVKTILALQSTHVDK